MRTEKTKVKQIQKFEAGKTYRIYTPESCHDLKKIHIESVFENTAYSPSEDWIDNAERMIVYRYWLKRGRWVWKVIAYWELCMYNEWSYKKNGKL